MIQISNLNSIDWIVLFLVLTTSIIGFNNGFIKEFLNLFIWTLSILFSFLVMHKLIIYNVIVSDLFFSIIIFLVLFLFIFVFLKQLVNYFVDDLKNFLNNNQLNNIFGLIFGFAKGLFLILLSTSGIIYLFYTTKDFPPILKNSLFFEPIKTNSIKIIEKIVNFI